MKSGESQYKKIVHLLPRQRGNVAINELQFIDAVMFVAENGCKWRALPKRFGNWHMIYTRMNR